MKKLLSLIILLMLICFSVQAKEYTFDEVKECEPLDYTINRLCDLNNVFVTGKIKSYYENGNLKEEGNFKDGKAEGLVKGFYENGNLEREENYKDGKLEGLTKIYYENGNLKFEVNFKDGKAVSGYMYDIYGKRTKMTNAHLHNLTKDLPKAD